MQKLSAVAVLVMSLVWVPVWGQEKQSIRVPITSEQKPEACTQIDQLKAQGTDHIWTHDERMIRNLCDTGSGYVPPRYPTQADIEAAVAKSHTQQAAQPVNEKYDPSWYGADPKDTAAAVAKWNTLHANGECKRAAQAVVAHGAELEESCKTISYHSAACRTYANQRSTVAFCAMPQDEPNHGFKFRAILKDPMPTATVMAQEKPQQ